MLDIIYLLTGALDAPPALDSTLERFLSAIAFEIEDTLWRVRLLDAPMAEEISALYHQLGDAARVHFLLSPAVCEVLVAFELAPSHQRVAELRSLVRRQAGIALDHAQLLDPAEAHWCAMGDEVLDRRAGRRQMTASPKLDSLILIDFDSPYARLIRSNSGTMNRPADEFSAAERAAISAKLDDALDAIDLASPTHGRLVRNYVRAIRIRKSNEFPHFISEHETSTIGEIRLLNPQLEHVRVADLAEALVHEGTHSFLSTHEYVKGRFVVPAAVDQRLVSPWSANALPVASFCHAAFVWFALFHLAQREFTTAGRPGSAAPDIARRRDRYAAGFLQPQHLSELVLRLEPAPSLRSDVLSSLDMLQDIVRGAATTAAP